MDDGLTTTMAMGYRVVDRIGSFVDGSMAVRARVAMRVVYA